MTRTDGERRGFTWSIDSAWNRASYSFIAAVLAFGAIKNLAGALLIGFALFAVLTAIVTVGRRD